MQCRPAMRAALLIVAMLANSANAAPKRAAKRPGVATALAVGVTATGFASMYLAFRDNKAVMTSSEALLGWGGLFTTLLGPSAGHFYAGESRRGVMTFGLRAGAFVVWLDGWFQSKSYRSYPDDPGPDGKLQLWLGGGVFAATTLYDFWDAHRAVGRANRHLDAIAVPTAVGATHAPGIAVVGSF